VLTRNFLSVNTIATPFAYARDSQGADHAKSAIRAVPGITGIFGCSDIQAPTLSRGSGGRGRLEAKPAQV
jgi:hypothetical protein